MSTPCFHGMDFPYFIASPPPPPTKKIFYSSAYSYFWGSKGCSKLFPALSRTYTCISVLPLLPVDATIMASKTSQSLVKTLIWFFVTQKVTIATVYGLLKLLLILALKQHNHGFAHAQDFDFWTRCPEFRNAGINAELSQIRLHRTQSTLDLP